MESLRQWRLRRAIDRHIKLLAEYKRTALIKFAGWRVSAGLPPIPSDEDEMGKEWPKYADFLQSSGYEDSLHCDMQENWRKNIRPLMNSWGDATKFREEYQRIEHEAMKRYFPEQVDQLQSLLRLREASMSDAEREAEWRDYVVGIEQEYPDHSTS